MPLTEMATPGQGGSGGCDVNGYKIEGGKDVFVGGSSDVQITLDNITSIKYIFTRAYQNGGGGTTPVIGFWSADIAPTVVTYIAPSASGRQADMHACPLPSSVSGGQFKITRVTNSIYYQYVEWFAIGT